MQGNVKNKRLKKEKTHNINDSLQDSFTNEHVERIWGGRRID